MNGGKHYDKGKLRLDLITPEMQVAQAAVLTYGADKYGDNNWEQGMPWHKLFGAALRHLWKWWAGETLDPESGLSHLWHAYCNVGFLLTYEERQAGTDDRDERSTYPWSDPMGVPSGPEAETDEREGLLHSKQPALVDEQRADEILEKVSKAMRNLADGVPVEEFGYCQGCKRRTHSGPIEERCDCT